MGIITVTLHNTVLDRGYIRAAVVFVGCSWIEAPQAPASSQHTLPIPTAFGSNGLWRRKLSPKSSGVCTPCHQLQVGGPIKS